MTDLKEKYMDRAEEIAMDKYSVDFNDLSKEYQELTYKQAEEDFTKGGSMNDKYEKYLNDKLMVQARRIGRIEGNIKSHRLGILSLKQTIDKIEEELKYAANKEG